MLHTIANILETVGEHGTQGECLYTYLPGWSCTVQPSSLTCAPASSQSFLLISTVVGAAHNAAVQFRGLFSGRDLSAPFKISQF